jgi:hypothetical protein
MPAEAIEVINRNALVSIALKQGYVAYLPVYDPGIDLILLNEATNDLKRVQQKGRWTINKKYKDREIWVAFPDRGVWYVVPHDEVLLAFSEQKGFTNTDSWARGEYSYAPLSKEMVALLEPYRFGDPKSAEQEAEEAAKA